MAFIGQYSAGKSSLINTLLGRQILPGGRVETTPLLTYISYGAAEGGRLFYTDGDTEDISLETVMDITQSNRVTRNLDNVEHLEIFLNEPILADGMVLLDTPGINTLIKRHEQLLANSLALASAIIYVVSGAPSRVALRSCRTSPRTGSSFILCARIATRLTSGRKVTAKFFARIKKFWRTAICRRLWKLSFLFQTRQAQNISARRKRFAPCFAPKVRTFAASWSGRLLRGLKSWLNVQSRSLKNCGRHSVKKSMSAIKPLRRGAK